MVWVRIDDGFPDHPKVVAAGHLAGWLHICGLAYCNRNLTDGFIPRGAAHRLTDFGDAAVCAQVAETLCLHGIWEKCAGGYRVHDYLDYQKSRVEVEGERKSARDRMRAIRRGSSELRPKFAGSSRTPAFKPEPLRTKTLAATPPEPHDKKPRAARPDDAYWDVLIEVMGGKPTELEAGRWGKAIKAVKGVGATPEMLRSACAVYKVHSAFADKSLTPTAIANNWNLLMGNPKTAQDMANDELKRRIEENERRWAT